MKWKQLTVTVVVSFVILCLMMIIKLPTLLITSEGQIKQFYVYKESAELKIRWQHSVEKEDWEEMFVLQEGAIELTGTRFKTFGAGVPNDAGEHTFIKDGWVYMTEIQRTIGEKLSIRTGENTNHRLQYEQRSILNLDKNQAYKIIVCKQSVLNTIKNYISVKVR